MNDPIRPVQMQLPLVSILLVVRNEKDNLQECLDSLLRQDYPRERMDFAFVDGCSTDGTYALLEQQAAALNNQGYSARLLTNPKRILSSGWNIGIKEARGEYICRIDGHSAVCPSYLSTGIQCFLAGDNARLAAVGGWLKHSGTSRSARLIAVLLSSRFAVGNSPFRAPPATVSQTDTAVYGIYRRKVFDTVGLFDETLERNQDMVLHNKMKRAGFSFMTHPGMKSTYYVRSSLKKLLKKAFGDGRWVALAGSRNFSLRHKIPCCFVLYLAALFLMYPLAIITSNMSLKCGLAVAGMPLMLYFLLALWFSIRSEGCGMARVFLPPMFLLFHLAYGVGTLQGYAESFNKYGLRFGRQAGN